MIVFSLISICIIMMNVTWESWIILHNGKLEHPGKFISHIILGLISFIWVCVWSNYEYDTYAGLITYTPFMLFLYWFVKDAAMGIILHGDPFYLGPGRWDTMWKKAPLFALWGIKISGMFVTYHIPDYTDRLHFCIINIIN